MQTFLLGYLIIVCYFISTVSSLLCLIYLETKLKFNSSWRFACLIPGVNIIAILVAGIIFTINKFKSKPNNEV